MVEIINSFLYKLWLTSWQPHDSVLLMFRQYFDIELSYEANVLEVWRLLLTLWTPTIFEMFPIEDDNLYQEVLAEVKTIIIAKIDCWSLVPPLIIVRRVICVRAMMTRWPQLRDATIDENITRIIILFAPCPRWNRFQLFVSTIRDFWLRQQP